MKKRCTDVFLRVSLPESHSGGRGFFDALCSRGWTDQSGFMHDRFSCRRDRRYLCYNVTKLGWPDLRWVGGLSSAALDGLELEVL